ncbi:hypothetical protein, partial [Planococcus antarcticus]|uniref:hypothetical protein n=1 Tax=Planococcus antarcticus TaxID=161360 RepID=UPI001EE682FC
MKKERNIFIKLIKSVLRSRQICLLLFWLNTKLFLGPGGLDPNKTSRSALLGNFTFFTPSTS